VAVYVQVAFVVAVATTPSKTAALTSPAHAATKELEETLLDL